MDYHTRIADQSIHRPRSGCNGEQPLCEAATGLRLLVLMPFPPRLDATDGGRRVTAQLLSRLARRHRVALLCLRGPDEQPVSAELQSVCDLVEEVPRPTNAPSAPGHWRRRARYVIGWVVGRPMWATDWSVADYASRVRALATSWAPDVIQVEFHIMAQYLTELDGCWAPRVLVEHEPGITAAYNWGRLAPAYARAVVRLDSHAWQRFERAQFEAVQAVVVFTERDRQTLAALGSRAPLVRIPLGTECAAGPIDPIGSLPPNLLFVGNFTHPPNVDAALWLAESILPRVREHHPEVRLTLVGENPPPELRTLSGLAVEVTGRVPDVSPYLTRASLVVAPLRLGGGMRVKVLEALAAGKALVASRLAVAGLQLADGQQVVLAEREDEFVEAIARLVGEPGLRAEFGRRAHAWALANLGWDASVASYEALYQQLVSAGRRA